MASRLLSTFRNLFFPLGSCKKSKLNIFTLATSAKWFFNSIFEQIQKLPFFLRIDNLCQYIG